MARLFDQALEIAHAFGLDETAMATLGEILDQEDPIVSLRHLLATAEPGEMIAPCDHSVAVGTTLGVVGTFVVHLDRAALVGTVGMYGIVEKIERHPERELYRVTVPAARVILEKAVLQGRDIERFNLQDARDHVANRLRKLGCTDISNLARARDATSSE